MDSSLFHRGKQPDLTDRRALLALARRFGFRPKERLSQNFLLDRRPIEAAVQAARLQPGDWVLEIGAGFGILTEALLAAGAVVTAFEIDERLAAALIDRLHDNKRLVPIAADFFRWYAENTAMLAERPFTIVSNLPYNASSYFFRTVLGGDVQPVRVVVLLQKELAERIVAQPGAMSMLAVSVQTYGEPSIVTTVPRSSFWPEPQVDSALLLVEHIRPGTADTEKAFRLARIGFANRRKQLQNTLASGLHQQPSAVAAVLRHHQIDPTCRAQDLSVVQWQILGKVFSEKKPGDNPKDIY